MEPLFREIQYFHGWVYLILIGAILIVACFVPFIPIRASAWVVFILLGFNFLVVFLLYMRLLVVVDDRNLSIQFGWLPVIRKQIPLSEIREIEACTYHPIKEFGGWGERRGRGGRVAFTAKGTGGICITLQNGLRYLIGSSRNGELATALRQGSKALAANAP